jgi:hypothetical protein
MDIYCPGHKENHHFSNVEAEALVVTLAAEIAELSTSPDDCGAIDEDPAEQLHNWCPRQWLDIAGDSEVYGELVEQAQMNRREQEKADRLERAHDDAEGVYDQ